MSNKNNQIIDEGFVDEMAKQVYNTTKILYAFDEKDRERIIKQLVKDFLKQYIKTEDHVIIEKSSGN